MAKVNFEVFFACFQIHSEINLSSTDIHFTDAVFSGKAVAMTDRTASNVIFSDCKDRLLRVPPHAMFGAYYAAFNQGRLPSADALHPSNHAANAPTSGTPSSNLSAAAIAAATAFGGAVADLASILTTGHTSHDTVQQVGKVVVLLFRTHSFNSNFSLLRLERVVLRGRLFSLSSV